VVGRKKGGTGGRKESRFKAEGEERGRQRSEVGGRKERMLSEGRIRGMGGMRKRKEK